MAEEFNLKLSDINRDLKKEGLPIVGREQCRYLMGRQKGKVPKRKQNRHYVEMLKEGVHYSSKKCNSYNKYLFSLEGEKLLYGWSISRLQDIRNR